MTAEHPRIPDNRAAVASMLALALATLLLALAVQPIRARADTGSVQAAEGLWAYTGLVTKDGVSMPLTGIFLISNGYFLQQSIFDGEPLELQGAMAHAGPYRAGGAGLLLTSEQTLSIAPEQVPALRSAGVMQHDIAIQREGEKLRMQFGGGTSTVQTFDRLGDAAEARIYRVSDGALALADGFFILVTGSEQQAVTGYGRYSHEGETLQLEVIRWAEAAANRSLNLRDTTLTARFDGSVLTLEDGRSFTVLDEVQAP